MNVKTMILILSLTLTAIAAAASEEIAPRTGDVNDGVTYRITSIACDELPKEVRNKVLDAAWTDSKQSCFSCMACGCTCSVQGRFTAPDMSIDYRYVSCEEDVYTLHAGGETYTCHEPERAPIDEKQSPDNPDSQTPGICPYPMSSLDHTDSRTIEGQDGLSDYVYSIEYYKTRDNFAQVKQFLDMKLDTPGIVGLDTNGQFTSIYALGTSYSTVTIIEDRETGGTDIMVFRFDYVLK